MGVPLDLRIAWAAGLFEGEGGWALDKGRTLRATLTMTDEDVVQTFADVVGVGSVWQPPVADNRKRAWRWHVHGAGAVYVGELFRQYLHERRRARLDEIHRSIEDYREHATRERVCGGCGQPFRPAFGSNAERTRFCSRSCAAATRLGYVVTTSGGWQRRAR